jgi:hypothetical protein
MVVLVREGASIDPLGPWHWEWLIPANLWKDISQVLKLNLTQKQLYPREPEILFL